VVEDRTEFVPVGRDSSVTVDDHDIEAGRCVGQQSGQSRPVIPDTLDTRPLVGVGRDMLPVALSGELGSELAYLSVQPAPACTTGGFSGVDGNSPHGVSSLARCHW
jgi:hypothetical protein